jgi:radical SAM/Cys-rich protein
MAKNIKLKTLNRRNSPLATPAEQVQLLQDRLPRSVRSFQDQLADAGMAKLHRQPLTTLQINVGKVCNQTCSHCHVDAGPDRRERMSYTTACEVIEFLSRSRVTTLDITGGAPEMNPHFRMLVREARGLGKQVLDRCNLTILLAKGFTDLPEFLAEQQVNIIASLPCYLEENCDAQRGEGVFAKSIQAIGRLNQLGYGQPDSGLSLDLVYNPTGWDLPPPQRTLELVYQEELRRRHGIQFNRLYTITNMPISRFLDDLLRQEKFEVYLEKLFQHFNPQTLDHLMCRSLLSIDWNGYLYDCDFNQMLDLAVKRKGRPVHLSEVTDNLLAASPIKVGNHCYGCTAGCGSSCGGSLIG